MYPTQSLIVMSGAGVLALMISAAVFAWCWARWLDLKRRELDGGDISGRIELADLRARVKMLEAIAAGIE